MKKMLLFLVLFVSSFFFVEKVSAYIENVDTKTNTFTIKSESDFVVIHKKMDLNGEYTIIDLPNDEGIAPIGVEITQDFRRSYTGFKQPERQSIVIDFETTTIEYLYEREKYRLTIENEEYVNTTTPSGEYYYETNIYLLADETDAQGRPFIKWSDGSIDLGHSFTMTEDVTIKPIYGTPYIVEFDTHEGSPAIPSRDIEPGSPIGAIPVVTRDDCELSEGSYSERNCTYAYRFEGWYKEAEYIHQVNEDFVPTGDITLHAKWNKVYFHDDEEVFTGHNMINTDIALFSAQNADKDFIVTFTLSEMRNGQGVGGEKNAVLFSDLNETQPVYPGTMFRYNSDNKVRDFQIVANVDPGDNTYGGRMTSTVSDFEEGMTVVMKRESGILSYSIDGGQTFIQYNDFSNFNRYFNIPATFGGEYKPNMTEYRYFKGTLTDMTVELIEPKSYTVKFNANGGTGMMIEQVMPLTGSVALRPNNYTKTGCAFIGWNTAPDGSGTSYTDEQVVTGLANEGEVVTLYAQWLESASFFVAFDANGGVGSMDNQEFAFDTAQNLNPSAFSKEGYIFDSWNTEPDGSGTRYEEEERVMNLTNVPDGVVTLYAQYGKREYHHAGEITFNGVDDYIDTEVNLYSAVNIDKDFDISFDLISADPINGTVYQPTIINAKDEEHIISGTENMVPGFVVRFNGKYSPIDIKGRWGSRDASDTVPIENNMPIHFEFHRRNGVITSTYSYNDGANTHTVTLINQSNWSLESNCNSNITIGARVINGVADRFFTGTLADIDIVVYD